MADDRLREAERVYRETGSVADEARLLTERVRAGLLAPERLDLAAELRYEPAVLAQGGPRTPTEHSLSWLFARLERFGLEVLTRGALVVARRCSKLAPLDASTQACLAAVEAWLDCPCVRHRAEVEQADASRAHGDARHLTEAVLGRQLFTTLHPAAAQGRGAPHEPDSVLVAAVRRSLVRWALAPYEAVTRNGASRGALIDLRVGWSYDRTATRCLFAGDRLRAGMDDRCGLQFENAPGMDFEIVRTKGGFEVRDHARQGYTFVNEERVRQRELLTGDVISADGYWIEVRILDAPYENEIETAVGDADRLRTRSSDDPMRIQAAAAAGHLGATLAAFKAGIPVRPRFLTRRWVISLPAIPPRPAASIALRLAREIRIAPTASSAEREAFDGALAAVTSWLEAPSAEARGVIEGRAAELHAAFGRTPPGQRTFLLGRMGRACLYAALPSGERPAAPEVGLWEAVDSALFLGVPEDKARALMEEEVLRWALGD